MNSNEANKRIDSVKDHLLEMQAISSISVDSFVAEDDETSPIYHRNEDMAARDPHRNAKLHGHWEELQKIVPAGFDIDGNLIRHLSFNQAGDWYDISNNDIPRELSKIDQYKKRLGLIEYITTLHPEVSRVHEIVLNGDIDAALKTVFASFDARIRQMISAKPGESTVPAIGKAFKDGKLVAPQVENTESVRNFLQGVIGYYRSNILHNPLPASRNSLDSSLSLFALAHEAFKLLDNCLP